MNKNLKTQMVAMLMSLCLVIGSVPIKSEAFGLGTLNIDLKQLKNDSQVVQSVFDAGVKEGIKLLLSIKDLKPALITDKTETESYSGLGLNSASKAEGFAVLGASVSQRHNLRLDYNWQASKGSFYASYTSLVDGLLGKSYVKNNLEGLLKSVDAMAPGTEQTKDLGGQWQVLAFYGKTVEGQNYLRLKLSTFFRSEADALKNVVKNSEISYDAPSVTKHGIIIKDKAKKQIVAKVYTDFKIGEMVISTKGDSGLNLFKQVANIGFKQIDPSGKTTFESVFSKELSLLSEYEKFSKNAKSYKLLDQAGQAKAIASENQLLKPLAEKFKLGDSLMTKDGAPAIKVRSGLVEGALYFKDGFLNFSFSLWPLSK